jgi:hypothetical protein
MTMGDLIWVSWYATVLRQDVFAEEVSRIAPVAMRYGATQYSVQRSDEDRYKITQMSWFASKDDWYRYWDGPEMIEFRARNMGHYQVPIAYAWQGELVSGALGPEVPLAPEHEPEPEPQAAV